MMSVEYKKSPSERIDGFHLSLDYIDLCLAYLKDREIVSGDEIEDLITADYDNPSNATLDLLSRTTDRIFEAVKEDNLRRWDFDPFDASHRRQQKSLLTSRKPGKLSLDEECKVLCLIVDDFRDRCKMLVDAFIKKFDEAESYPQVMEWKSSALTLGVLRKNGIKEYHNHSIINSKRVFDAMIAAIRRMP